MFFVQLDLFVVWMEIDINFNKKKNHFTNKKINEIAVWF